jgi:hypothetical protein
MIKPIVYHDFEEKAALEKQLMSEIPRKKLASAAKTLTTIFSGRKKKSVRKSK